MNGNNTEQRLAALVNATNQVLAQQVAIPATVVGARIRAYETLIEFEVEFHDRVRYQCIITTINPSPAVAFESIARLFVLNRRPEIAMAYYPEEVFDQIRDNMIPYQASAGTEVLAGMPRDISASVGEFTGDSADEAEPDKPVTSEPRLN